MEAVSFDEHRSVLHVELRILPGGNVATRRQVSALLTAFEDGHEVTPILVEPTFLLVQKAPILKH